jgi:hypothetical protein
MEYRHLVFELDNESLELQEARAHRLMEERIVNRVVFSGKKSLHCRISLQTPCADKETYGEVWNYLNGLYFDSLADPQCKNPSRLTRAPNGIRDNGALQTATYPAGGYFELELNYAEIKLKELLQTQERPPQIRFSRPYSAMVHDKGGKKPLNTAAQEWLNGAITAGTRHETLKSAVGSFKWAGYALYEVIEIVRAAVSASGTDDEKNLTEYAEYLWEKYS